MEKLIFGKLQHDYYWVMEDTLWILRQVRYRGQRHPHDIMAIAKTRQDRLSAQATFSGSIENPVK